MGTKILGTGIYLPEKTLTNADLEAMVDTSDEWITTRTGIKERRIAKEESATDMALEASLQALRNAQVEAKDIDLVVLATLTPDKRFPSTACLLQASLGVKNLFSFDISAACSGFLYALDLADAYIKAGKVERILVVGVEKLSEIVDWEDRSTCVLFGDGAGAMVISSSQDESDVLASKMYSDGEFWNILYADKCGYIRMKGKELFKLAVRSMESVCKEVIQMAGLGTEDVDLVVPHQANIRIINSLADKLGIPKEKVFSNIERYGNTSAASIPIAFHEALSAGRIKRGDTVLLTAMGGGLTWGATLLRY